MPEQAATGNIATEVNCLPLWQDVVSDCHCHGVCTSQVKDGPHY